MEKEEETVIVKGKEYAFIKMPFFMQRYDGQCTIEQLNEAYYSLYPCFQKILKEEHGEDFSHNKTVNHVTDKKRYSLYTRACKQLNDNLINITGMNIKKRRPAVILGSKDFPRLEMPFLMRCYEGQCTLDELNEAYYNLYPCFQKILKEEHGEDFTHERIVNHKTNKKRYQYYQTAITALTENLKLITTKEIRKKM